VEVRLRRSGVSVLPVSSRGIDLAADSAKEALGKTLVAGDAVVFLSAITRDKGKDAQASLRNCAMGVHVADGMRSGLAHVIYVSSDAVYGRRSSLPISEHTPAAPDDLYGAMHLTRELMLAEASAAVGVPCCVLRPTMVYGPGDTHGSYGPNRFFRTAPSGHLSLFGEGEERRDFVFIEDVAALIARAIERRATGLLNVATGRSWTFAAVAEQVVTACPMPVAVMRQPRVMPVVHREFVSEATTQVFPDFRYTSLDEGIRLTAASVFGAASLDLA
jgi:nucleoside-diphosphate-sugar epimerase